MPASVVFFPSPSRHGEPMPRPSPAATNAARAPKPPDCHPYHLASLPPLEPPSKPIGDREEERALNSNAGELARTLGAFFPNSGAGTNAGAGADANTGVWEGGGEVGRPALRRPP